MDSYQDLAKSFFIADGHWDGKFSGNGKIPRFKYKIHNNVYTADVGDVGVLMSFEVQV